ncbi:hypothetical protein BGW39_006246 [Mortierella sp. 14UC]|nr:hypothetical protein BGW39_006246 [Mortierella sp. 14UC]
MTPTPTQKPLTVMIVGAGLGGLTLALLLEKAKIEYQVYEKAAESGYATRVCVRPEFYDLLLLSRVPKETIHLNQRIVSIHQNNDTGIRIEISKGQSFTADILVGAVGTYSNIRQSLYEQLKAQGLLPVPDQEMMVVHHTTMVGLTEPLDPEEYPALKDTELFS